MTLDHHISGCLCSWCSLYKRGKNNVTTPTTTASAAEYADFIMDEVVEREQVDDNPNPQVEVEVPAPKVLVIGPMTGRLDFNRPMFERAARAANDAGMIPTIPHQLDDTGGLLPGTDEAQFTVTPEARAGYLRRTARFLTRMDGVVLLPGWQKSDGACVEVILASVFGLDFFLYDDVNQVVARTWGEFPPPLYIGFDGIARHVANLYPGSVDAVPEWMSDSGHTDDRPGDPRFHALLRQIGDLHDRKQADYGRPTDPFANVRASEDFGIPPWVGALVRANDKMRRLQKAAEQTTKGEAIDLANEGVEDSFMDLAVYALIGHVLFNETEEAE